MVLRRFLWAPVAGALCLAFVGCTTTDPRGAFGDVDRSVSTRLGRPVSVQPPTPGAEAATKAVHALLAQPLTAESAAAVALLGNPALQAQLEEVGISQAQLAQAARLPNLQLAGSWRFPDRPPSVTDAEYSLTGELLDLLTLSARKDIAGQVLRQAEQTASARVLQLAADAETAFYRLQGQLDLAKRLTTIAAISDAAVDFARRQYTAGNISALALHNVEASAAQAHLDVMAVQARAAGLRETLNRELGIAGDENSWRIADELPPLPASEPDLKGLQARALRQRLDLAAARSRAGALATALRLKGHVRFIPALSVGVDTERTPDGQRVTGPSLGLELPLFDQGQPALARLAARYRQAGDEARALAVDIESEVREQRAALLAARQAAEYAAKQLLPIRAEILQETLRQYNAMQQSTYDLLFARQNEESAATTYVTALRDYWIARVALEHAIGGRLPGPPAEASSASAAPQP